LTGFNKIILYGWLQRWRQEGRNQVALFFLPSLVSGKCTFYFIASHKNDLFLS
jgi:hypothetical protein